MVIEAKWRKEGLDGSVGEVRSSGSSFAFVVTGHLAQNCPTVQVRVVVLVPLVHQFWRTSFNRNSITPAKIPIARDRFVQG